ncbi:DUF488 domain-containing protein [Natronosporangium hydrolyticum]|uniref:DUF488 domain-containing protein n=1 Tax=Natronosporangium hydrolyticum TaxID=2811111 RepID=A0A895YTX1_9ACTN|nr:DUF488 domain-containing protein [Natronosporangium hydrolyticum]
MATRSRGVVGVGYQQRPSAEFVDDLGRIGVSLVVDVRLTPLSRKSGFSKTALARALASAGICYEHRPELGNPRPNRAGFTGSASELAAARSVYRALLEEPNSALALDDIAAASEKQLVALLCYEADQQRCHRDVVIEALAGRAAV